jgi:uncharacterized protein YheU (UPF0270 family)
MLEPDTLRTLIEEFVTRDGTDYGAHEASLEQKIRQVQRQIERGEAAIVFDPETESCSILAKSDPRFAELARPSP